MLLHLYNKQNILILTGTYPVCHLQAPHWGRHYQEDSHGGPQEIVTDRRVWWRHEGGHLIAAGGGSSSSSSSSSVGGFTPDPAPDGADQAPPLVGQLWRGCDVTILVNPPYLSMGSMLLEMIRVCRHNGMISLSPMFDGDKNCHSAFLNVSSKVRWYMIVQSKHN